MNLQKKQFVLLYLGLAVVALLLANSILFYLRFDISSAQSYAISPVSKKLMANLPAQAEITYFISPALKSKDPVFQQIEDVLLEYSLASKSKVSLTIADPSKPEVENEAGSFGIQPRNLSVVDNAQVSQTRVYSGIVIKYLDNQKIIPFVSSPASLEYELGVQLLQLSRERNLVLAVLNGGPGGDDIFSSYQLVLGELSKLYDVRPLSPGSDIPIDTDVLFVFKGEALGDQDLVAIESFIMSGKGVLIGAEPFGIDLGAGIGVTPPRSDSKLLAMLRHYGITVEEALVLDEYNKQFPVTRQQGSIQYQEMVPYPFWINLAQEDGNQGHPLINGVESLDLLWASPVTLAEGLEGDVIFSSTPGSKLANGQIDLNPEMGAFLLTGNPGEAKARSLVVSRTGTMESWFHAQTDIADTLKATIPIKTEAGRLLVVGDSDFASDLIQYSDSGANFQFILNALVWLGNDPELLALRARQSANPGLTKVKDPKARASIETISIVINGVLLPLAIGIFGVIRLVGRRKNNQVRG